MAAQGGSAVVEVGGPPASREPAAPARGAGGAPAGAAQRRKVLVFRAAAEWFALGLASVREVCPRSPVTRVPRAPAEVLGVMNLRGRVVTLVDLARCLGLPADGAGGAHVVMLDLGDPDMAVGLVAERIDQVLEVEGLQEGEGEAAAAPGIPGAALVEIGGRAVTLLDPVRVLAQVLPGVGGQASGENP